MSEKVAGDGMRLSMKRMMAVLIAITDTIVFPQYEGLAMFERRTEPLLPRSRFTLRMLRNIAMGIGLIGAGLFVGTVGYMYFENLAFVDAMLNASMILTCMGPIHAPESYAGKLFATSYAIFSGVAFPTTIGIMMAPAIHRFLHKLHLDEEEDDGPPTTRNQTEDVK